MHKSRNTQYVRNPCTAPEDVQNSPARQPNAYRRGYRPRREYLQQLERDKDAILCYYSDMALEAMNAASPEEQRQLYGELEIAGNGIEIAP